MNEPTSHNGSKYPQLNVNTGVSVGLVAMLAGSIYWSAGVKQDVSYHELRITSLETGVKELRASIDSARLLSAQGETRLESRLTRMEIILADVQARLTSMDREHRALRPPSNNLPSGP